MILRFTKVKVHNFFCYSDAELELDNLGYSIVSGRNNMSEDGAISNGSGKSSIFNAICYALTGETAQGISNNIENIYTDPNDCWVEVEFFADNDTFLIRRYITPRSDMKIYINGEDRSGKGIRESQQLLKTYLPDLTSKLIGSIIILGQGLPYRFTYNTPSARKALLEDLTKSDYMVQAIKDNLDSRKDELKQQLRSYEDKNIENSTQIKLYSDRLNKLEKDLNEYNEYSYDCDINDRILDLENSLSKYDDKLRSLNNERIKIEDLISRLNDKKTNIILNQNEVLNKKLVDIDNDIENIRTNLVEERSTEKQLENEIKMIDSIVDVCPTCGQKIPGPSNIKRINSDDLKIKLKSVKDITKSYLDNEKSLNDKKAAIISNHNAALNSKISDIDSDISLLKIELSAKNSIIKNLSKLQISDSQEKLKLLNIQNNYDNVISEIDSVNSKLKSLNEIKQDIELNIVDINEHLRTVQDLIALAKREFRSTLLINVVAYLDRKSKEYAMDVFGNDSVSITVDENYIDVMFNNKYYEALSGGEKQKIDIIIQLALRDLLSNQLNIHSNILVLDEGLDFLDAKGSEGVLNLIQNRLNDLESVFIISHHVEELNISYDTEIIVEKGESGISTISVH